MKIMIVTDAWYPQMNGVVHTLNTLRTHLVARGHDVGLVTPADHWTLPCPTYPDIRLAPLARGKVAAALVAFAPDAVHIATEGPLGLAARNACLKLGLRFTTSFLSRFPEYVHARFRLPTAWTYAMLRWFHKRSQALMVASQSIQDILEARGFINIKRWTRGVDTELFRPRSAPLLDLPRPILLYVGRIAVEKNLDAFLGLATPGSKVVVGDGPQRAELQARFPDAHFLGAKFGEDLARHYAAADVFVFPSLTDTFGNVQLEALASGVPVVAFPAPGPRDVIDGSGAGVLDDDLGRAIHAALAIPRERCRAYAMNFTWERSIDQFVGNLHVARPGPAAATPAAAPG